MHSFSYFLFGFREVALGFGFLPGSQLTWFVGFQEVAVGFRFLPGSRLARFGFQGVAGGFPIDAFLALAHAFPSGFGTLGTGSYGFSRFQVTEENLRQKPSSL
jgi:hypothetical protein